MRRTQFCVTGLYVFVFLQPTNMDFAENLYGGAGVAEAYVQAWARWHTLAPHRSVAAWCQRLAVVHSDKVLLLAACYASLASPDVVGLALQALAVAAAVRTIAAPHTHHHHITATFELGFQEVRARVGGWG